ncbi:MAG: AMP-binding protein [Desulfomonile tiedjei]|nr:AMP-binding protein [Desulfomonile tiedjei]
MNLATNLERSALFFPGRPAISEAGTEISYAQLNDRSNRIATGLIRMGVKPGDRIGLFAPNSADWVAFYFGVLKAGAVAITLSSILRRDELTLLLNHSKPRLVFTADEKLGDLEPLRTSAGFQKTICPDGDVPLQQILEQGTGAFKAVDCVRTDTAAVLYTGGTTGIPKGVMLSHENINAGSHNVAFCEHSSETDRALCFLPFNHVFGQIHIMNATILSCGCVEILPKYDLDQVLEATSTGRVTKFFAVPTIYARLLTIDRIKEKLGRIRYCFSAAASMAAEIVRQWKEQTDLTIHESYGLTESATAVTYNHYYRHVVASVGTTVPGVEVQIRDSAGNRVAQGQEGEICICGPNIMRGYLDNPEETEKAFWEDGWFRSGDIGVFDDDEYLFIVDRLKDMIITGGENVYPREVEEVIYTRPEVQECAVIGLPDKEWGERVTAVVVPRPGREVDWKELQLLLKAQLSPFKVPKECVTVEEMPKSATGKILKRELKKQISGE